MAETAEVDALDEKAIDKHADAVAANAGGIDIALNAVTLPRAELRVGEELQVTLTMLNTSRDAVSGCLGQGKGFHILGTTGDGGALEVVGHESCASRFRLRSGESISWSRPVSVGDVGIGAAGLSSCGGQVISCDCDYAADAEGQFPRGG